MSLRVHTMKATLHTTVTNLSLFVHGVRVSQRAPGVMAILCARAPAQPPHACAPIAMVCKVLGEAVGGTKAREQQANGA